MATGFTVNDNNNKLIKYTYDINREFVRENMFAPYMGEDVTSIIRVRNELKQGGDTINLPLVTRLKNTAIGSGTLVGSEETIDNYGQRVKVDWARNAVTMQKSEQQRQSADIFGEAKPLLSDWGKSLQRDEIIKAMMALPTETLPGPDIRVNGTPFETGTAALRDTWMVANKDRILFGNSTTNLGAGTVFATVLNSLDVVNDKCTAANLSLLKRIAKNADPHIRPFKTREGYEYYVAFMGTNPFRDLKNDLNLAGGAAVNLYARPRERNGPNGAPDNPLFQDGDQLYDGIIAHEVPEISAMVTSLWLTQLTNAGPVRCEPVFLCGQQAVGFCWGQMARPTFRNETDYQFITGTGIDMCYGVSKIFKKHPMAGPNLVQFGMATGFFASPAD